MRHLEGDVIRPRDCVLLRAGNKRIELPYVAKVAHLWENPEDGLYKFFYENSHKDIYVFLFFFLIFIILKVK